ncbi:MAG: Arc family DNA-binding protein [Acidobacteriota bacterium]
MDLKREGPPGGPARCLDYAGLSFCQTTRPRDLPDRLISLHIGRPFEPWYPIVRKREGMPEILIRNLEDSLVDRLRQRAAQHHRSLESEVRLILEEAATREFEDFR